MFDEKVAKQYELFRNFTRAMALHDEATTHALLHETTEKDTIYQFFYMEAFFSVVIHFRLGPEITEETIQDFVIQVLAKADSHKQVNRSEIDEVVRSAITGEQRFKRKNLSNPECYRYWIAILRYIMRISPTGRDRIEGLLDQAEEFYKSWVEASIAEKGTIE